MCERRLARTVVTKMAIEDGCQHERLVEQGVDALLVGLNTNDAVLRERSRRCTGHEDSTQLENSIRLTVREQANALEHVLDNNGLEDV